MNKFNQINMNKKIKKLTVSIIVTTIIAVISAGSLIVSFAESYAVPEQVNEVNIRLEQYTLNSDNKEVEYLEENKLVVPGEVVRLIPKVKNEGINCYVRAKVEFLGVEKTQTQDEITQGTQTQNSQEQANGIENSEEHFQNVDSLINLENNWQKVDEYYYYNKELKTNEIITLFKSFKIPESITSEDSGKIFTLKITIDAIQSKNTSGNIIPGQNEEGSVWYGAQIKQSLKRQYVFDDYTSSGKMVIKYENDSDKVLNLSEAIIQKFGLVVSGDTLTETIEVNNKSGKNCTAYLRIDKENLTQEQKDLLSKIKIKLIGNNGEVMYEGFLIDDNKIYLGEFTKDEENNLKIEINIPQEFDNDEINELLNIHFKWTIMANYTKANTPKTGDRIVISMVILLVSITMLIIMIAEKKKIERRCF